MLIHSERSAVFLRDEWAVDWKDQGGKKWYGGRSTAVEVNGIRWVATYQPLWQSDRSEFESYREILSNLVTRCDRKTKLVIGGDFNASVGTLEMRECDTATGPFGHGKTCSRPRPSRVVPQSKFGMGELILSIREKRNMEVPSEKNLARARWVSGKAGGEEPVSQECEN